MISATNIRQLFDYDGKALAPRNGVIASRRRQIRGYMEIRIERRSYLEHRLIWLWVYGEWPSGEVDHINGKRCDNRIENLRDATRTINQQNRRRAQSNNKVGLMGVSFHKGNGRYQAQIQSGGKRMTLGYFDSAAEAHACYLDAKRRLHAGNTI